MGSGLYLPSLDGFLETSLETSPSLHITRVDIAHLERFHSTAYLLSPKFVQVFITSSNLTKHRLYLIKQVEVYG